jgi:putative spermidine/putrescine transport system permease protein
MTSRSNVLAFLLIAPLALLVLLTFLVPLGFTLFRAVDDRELSTTLPKTAELLRQWDGKGLPSDVTFVSFVQELAAAREEQRAGALLSRLNFEQAGLRTKLLQASRMPVGVSQPSEIKTALMATGAGFEKPEFWRLLKRSTGPFTALYFLRSTDLSIADSGKYVRVEADAAVFSELLRRTFAIGIVVTTLCVIFAYPVAYTLTILPRAWASLGLTLILIPFWTSILVRTTAWFILLQREGPANAFMLATGLINEPLTMIFTRFAVYVAMLHVLLPFAILPMYSVMKGIKPEYVRAAASLGAPPVQRFLRIYLPLSMPGVAAGSIMVFMLAVGFYITPALVGGAGDQMVSAFIAFYTNSSANWGMAAALACLLIAFTSGIILVARILIPGFRFNQVRL